MYQRDLTRDSERTCRDSQKLINSRRDSQTTRRDSQRTHKRTHRELTEILVYIPGSECVRGAARAQMIRGEMKNTYEFADIVHTYREGIDATLGNRGEKPRNSGLLKEK